MPTRSSKRRLPDPAKMAHSIIQRISGEVPDDPPAEETKNPHAVALGKLGGAKGGKARAKALSSKQRIEIAKKAANKRWGRS